MRTHQLNLHIYRPPGCWTKTHCILSMSSSQTWQQLIRLWKKTRPTQLEVRLPQHKGRNMPPSQSWSCSTSQTLCSATIWIASSWKGWEFMHLRLLDTSILATKSRYSSASQSQPSNQPTQKPRANLGCLGPYFSERLWWLKSHRYSYSAHVSKLGTTRSSK